MIERGLESARDGVGPEGSAFLISLIRRFEPGITEGHLHTLIYAAQSLSRIDRRYNFQFRGMVPFSEDLDMSIAMLLWQNQILIRDNRIRAARDSWSARPAWSPTPAALMGIGSLDKLLALSYDALKVLAAMLHLEQDLQKSRVEAVRVAVRLFPIREDQALDLMLGCTA